MSPKPMSVVEDLQRQLEVARRVIRRMQERPPEDKAAEAQSLYREGASNWWIARLLRVPVSQARELTKDFPCRAA